MITALRNVGYLLGQAFWALMAQGAAPSPVGRCPACGYKRPFHSDLCRADRRKTKAPAKAEAPEHDSPYLPKLGDSRSW